MTGLLTYVYESANILSAEAYNRTSLGRKREDLPQLPDDVDLCLSVLDAAGITYTKTTLLPAEILPTQGEVVLSKAMSKVIDGATDKRTFFLSADKRLLDGHHDHIGALSTAENTPLAVVICDATIDELIDLFNSAVHTNERRIGEALGQFSLPNGLGLREVYLKQTKDGFVAVVNRNMPQAAWTKLSKELTNRVRPALCYPSDYCPELGLASDGLYRAITWRDAYPTPQTLARLSDFYFIQNVG